MGVIAKREMIYRFIGSGIFLFSLIISLLNDVYSIQDNLIASLVVITSIILFIFLISLKLESEFIRKNYLLTSIILSIIMISFFTLGLVISIAGNLYLQFIVISGYNVLLLITWYVSLSLYKKKKAWFIIGSILSVLLTLLIKTNFVTDRMGLNLLITHTVLVLIGFSSIMIIEIRMIKKGQLNYV
ncbi:MAG: hypothetical protein ACXABO_04260 [Promethearchaeota archaeon]|jgi:hypothetical protein